MIIIIVLTFPKKKIIIYDWIQAANVTEWKNKE